MHIENLDYIQENWGNKAVPTRLGYEEKAP